jgi:hypothetical protein
LVDSAQVPRGLFPKMLLLPEAATRKHTADMPKAYQWNRIRADGRNSKINKKDSEQKVAIGTFNDCGELEN